MGVFHPHTLGILAIPAIEKIITVMARLKVGYFNLTESCKLWHQIKCFSTLDYKADKVWRAEELAGKYHVQLDYYAKTMERVTNKKVKEKIVYSLTLKEEISE